MTIGKRIADERLTRRLSQRELAERANIHPATVGRVERGEHEPDMRTVRKLADALGLSVADLYPSTTAAGKADALTLPLELQQIRAEYPSFEAFVDELELPQLETLGHSLAAQHSEAVAAGDRPSSMQLYAHRVLVAAAIEAQEPPLARIIAYPDGRAEVTYLRSAHSQEEQDALEAALAHYAEVAVNEDLLVAV